jgi:hypothetical protein
LALLFFLASCSKDGDNGKDSLTRTTKEAAGSNCPYGGTKLETGLDLNGNGTLDDNEVTSPKQDTCAMAPLLLTLTGSM